LIRDELRKEKRRYEHYDRLGQGRIGDIPSDLPDIVTRIAMREQLLELFGSLSADQTNALILHYLLGYSVKEIADITGKPDATVYTLLLRGRKRLNRDRQDP
jgi:RNA polymerase sigma factor (sigma-70 family)